MAAAPTVLRADILPFLYLCPPCKSYVFHQIHEQAYGLMVKIPFVRKPLASTHKGYHVACVRCDTINGQLQATDVDKLANKVMPKSLIAAFPAIQQHYLPENLKSSLAVFVVDPRDQETASLVRNWLTGYRVET